MKTFCIAHRLANSLTVPDENVSNKRRPRHFHEFEDFIRDRKNQTQFAPLIKILQGFTITTKPVFWARLVCFGCICNEYVRKEGKTVGFEPNSLDLEMLLRASGDTYVLSNIDGYMEEN